MRNDKQTIAMTARRGTLLTRVLGSICVLALIAATASANSELAVRSTASAKVIGGGNANPTPPWMAGLHFFSAEQNAFAFRPFCGGSLIASGWVISAGHCFVAAGQADNPAAFDLSANDILLRLDSPDLNQQPQHFVRLLRVHPQFGINSQYDSDIALLQLSEPVALQPVSLADTATLARLENSAALDDVVRILGWGIFDDADFTPGSSSNTFPQFLQSADMDFLPFADSGCRNAWPQMTSNMLCAREVAPDPVSQPFGQDACSGDSGGPLLLPRGSLLSDGLINEDWLLGATSFGPANCVSTTSPGVYTRLSNFSDWIEQVSASPAANDPLVDIAVSIDIAAELNPNQAVLLPVQISNRSSRNSASNIQLTLQPGASLSLDAPADQGCISSAEGWQCSLPDDLDAGADTLLTFTGSWLDNPPARADIRASVNSDQDDYRENNNQLRQRPRVTTLSDPALSVWLIRTQGDGFVSLALNAENRSLANPARNSRLLLSTNHGFTMTSADPRCTRLDSDTPQCDLGDLPVDSSSNLVITFRGTGTLQARADLVADNGDSTTGDATQLRNVMVRSGNGGGGVISPALILLFGMLAVRGCAAQAAARKCKGTSE